MTDKTDTMQTRRAELQVLRTLPELLTHHLEQRPQIPVYMYYDNRVKQWQTLTVQETYERGGVSAPAKRIYEVIAENGETALHEIKRLGGF